MEPSHTTQGCLSDCLNGVTGRSDLERVRNASDTEARLKNDARQEQWKAFGQIASVEQPTGRGASAVVGAALTARPRAMEAPRRLGTEIARASVNATWMRTA